MLCDIEISTAPFRRDEQGSTRQLALHVAMDFNAIRARLAYDYRLAC